MQVLIGCEESGTVTNAFRRLGHQAFSCDIVTTRGNPVWHIQDDIMDALEIQKWDLVILHPDCTALGVCGNRTYAAGKEKHHERIEAIEWTMALWEKAKQHSKRVVLENPASVIWPHLRRVGALVQFIQPWQFGHGETKKTGLALHNVPELRETDVVGGREQRVWKMAPSPTRKRDRSVTYQGIADAMANQWGELT